MPKPADSDDTASVASGAQTLERGLDLLERVVREPASLAELACRSGLPRRTAARLVVGLIDRGFLYADAGGLLRAGPKLIQLGALAQSRIGPVAMARGPLRALSARTGLSSFMGRRDGDHSVHLHRTSGAQRVMVATPVGTRRRLAETSLGKALMLDDGAASWQRLFQAADPVYRSIDRQAQMRMAAAAGVVVHAGPPPDSIRAVAVPVRDASGQIVAAISVASVAQYLDTAGLEMLAPDVRATADTISRALGWAEPLGSAAGRAAQSLEPSRGDAASVGLPEAHAR